MLLKIYSAAASIVLLSLISCAGSDNNGYVDKSIIPDSTERTATQPAANNMVPNPANTVVPNTVNPGNTTVLPGATKMNINPQSNAAQANQQNNVVQTIQQTANMQPPAGVKLNPAHGQPGHRCDISVGAPLDSKPAPNNASQPSVVTTQQPAQNNTVVTQMPAQKTAPGMNPPHGEPGHRCDIAVGAPLNSKPAAPAAVQASTTAVPPLLTPVKPDSSKN